ncbi:hypothetical protein ACFVZR_15785 [Streptomyces sp. NPDC058316]
MDDRTRRSVPLIRTVPTLALRIRATGGRTETPVDRRPAVDATDPHCA